MEIDQVNRIASTIEKVEEPNLKCNIYESSRVYERYIDASDVTFSESQKLFFSLLGLLNKSAIESGQFDVFIASVKPNGAVRKYLILCLIEAHHLLPFSVATIFSVLALLEGDGEKRRWVNHALTLIAEGKNDKQLKWPLEFYSISRGSVVIRGKQVGIPLFSCHRGLKVIHAAASNAVDSLVGIKPVKESVNIFQRIIDKLKVKKQGIEKSLDSSKTYTVVFVSSRPFPGENNTHFNVLINVAKAMNFGLPNVKIKLAMSPEDALLTPWANFGVYDKPRLNIHNRRWEEVNTEDNALFPSELSDLSKFSKTEYLDEMFSWIDKQAPAMVVFLSGVYESYIARAISSEKYTTVFLPTSIKHVPQKNFDMVISTKEAYVKKLIAANTDKQKIFPVPVVVDVFQKNSEFTTQIVREHNDEFIITTVLGGGRLLQALKELEESDYKLIASLFSKFKQLKWILVGEQNFSGVQELSPEFAALAKEGRLQHISYVKELRGFYRSVDLIFNIPGVTGGGQGIAAAVNEGVPALTSDQSDCCSFVPKAGQYKDLHHAVKIIDELIVNEDKFSELAQSCSDKLKEHTIENVSKKWQEIILIGSQMKPKQLEV